MFAKVLERIRNAFGSGLAAGQSGGNPDFDAQLHGERVRRWQASGGDERFRTTYDCLNPESIVLDLGGYRGDFSFCMNEKYGATCHVFEVVPELCERIVQASRGNSKIIIHPFGLAGRSRKEELFLAEEGSSIYCNRASDERRIIIDLMKASAWFKKELKGRMVGLMKINIEGGEFELLEHLLEEKLVTQLQNIQVQFHEDVVPDASSRMRSIQARLAKTHRLTYQEEFVWENWELLQESSSSRP